MEKRILTFDEIPSVTGVVIKRQFVAPRAYLSPSNFETDKTWHKIETVITNYMEENGFECSLPKTVAVFSIQKKLLPDDETSEEEGPVYSNLEFDIHVCLYPQDSVNTGVQYNVEFRRIRGDAFAMLNIFLEIRRLLQ